MIRKDSDHLAAAAEQFKSAGRIFDIREHGRGHVHDTFLVAMEPDGGERFILQRINTGVFRQPELIMGNMRTLSEHVQGRLPGNAAGAGRRWVAPQVLTARDGRDYWVDSLGDFWRAMDFIDGAQSFETIQSERHAREVGWALGMFHSLIHDLPMDNLADTLPGFHITPWYLRHYDRVLAEKRPVRSPEIDFAMHFVRERRDFVNVLEGAKAMGKLCLHPIHGDPKVNNVMIDVSTGQAISLVDLDTVKPGLVLYDLGDCLRSSCNLAGEAAEELEKVPFEPALCRAILKGYLSPAKHLLTQDDCEYLYDAIRLITFELGLRFLTDYLEGNVYFKVRSQEHNLVRALTQFKLTESVESQEDAIRAIVRDLR